MTIREDCVLLVLLTDAQQPAEFWVDVALPFVFCAAVYLVIAIPTGRLFENFTKEPAVKHIWRGVLAVFAVMVFVGMSGVGEFISGWGRANAPTSDPPKQTEHLRAPQPEDTAQPTPAHPPARAMPQPGHLPPPVGE